MYLYRRSPRRAWWAAALFRLDRSRSYAELQAVVDDLLAWLATHQQRSLRRAFGIWLRRVLLRRRLPGVVIPEIDDLREVKAMLAERWEQVPAGRRTVFRANTNTPWAFSGRSAAERER